MNESIEKPVIAIVKTGSAVPEASRDGRDFQHWFSERLGPERFDYRVVNVEREQRLPAPDDDRAFDAVVITGSPAMVTQRLDWSERTARWLAAVHRRGVPMLGVCYGHQLLAHALGGRVGANPRGRFMGRAVVHVIDDRDALIGPFALSSPFHVTHSEVVLEPPAQSRTVATAVHDPHHCLHFGRLSWGVQFHPEFDRAIMTAYLEARTEVLRVEGRDPRRLIDELVGDTRGTDFLRHFGDLVMAAVRPGASV